MNITLADFQNATVTKLQDYFFRSKKKNIILSAPTGSGKTVMMISLMEEIIKNNPYEFEYSFVWLTPGNGELEEQSWASASEKSTLLNSRLLPDALLDGFKGNDATFINWELVKNDTKNIALKDGEQRNLDVAIAEAKDKNIHFVVIIDEEHRNQTTKAQKVIDRFNADKIIRVSATAKSSGSHFDHVEVSEDDAIAEGMIVRRVELNSGIIEGDEFASSNEYFLKLADEKRIQIKKAYAGEGLNINPLVLIQFPDEKGKDDSSYMMERGELIREVENYLKNELQQQTENIARWLSGDHFNTKDVEWPDSEVNYLLMKQAISTGWDAPRAKILVKLRLNTEAIFTLQTIGRIRRMPERKHYDNELLDNAFIYSNDEKYVSEVIGQGLGHKIATYTLHSNAPNFGLQSLKPKESGRINTRIVIENLHMEFVSKFKLSTDISENKRIFENHGWDFSPTIKRVITISDDLTKDIAFNDFQTYTVNGQVDLRKTRFTLLDREQKIMKALPVFSPSEVNDILIELFSWKAAGAVRPPLLRLNDYQLRAFIINNYLRIAELGRNMQIAIQTDLFDEASEGKFDTNDFNLPNFEIYAVSEKLNPIVMDKNVYAGYTTANHVKQRKTERAFEIWLQNSKYVRWWYRSPDRGKKYFSVPVGSKKEGFFPDYLVKGTNGRTYIFEVKYIQNLIPSHPLYVEYEQDAHQKFDALKGYINEKKFSGDANFGFIQPRWYDSNDVEFLYNNTSWDADVNNTDVWKSINGVFEH